MIHKEENKICNDNRLVPERTFHPKEFKNNNNLKIDYLWYKENQILPLVKKLTENIRGIRLNKLYECLNIKKKQTSNLLGN